MEILELSREVTANLMMVGVEIWSFSLFAVTKGRRSDLQTEAGSREKLKPLAIRNSPNSTPSSRARTWTTKTVQFFLQIKLRPLGAIDLLAMLRPVSYYCCYISDTPATLEAQRHQTSTHDLQSPQAHICLEQCSGETSSLSFLAV